MLEPQISINLFGALVEIDKIMFYVQTCSEETSSTCPGVHMYHTDPRPCVKC